jgi:outer membrane protein OmpA-like peptidoglycan-associated protein
MIQGNKNNWLTHGITTFLIAGLALLTFGCAGPKENMALKNARDAYMQAKANPSVEANGAVALYEAGKILTKAEHAESDAEMNHLAYMAEKQTAIAVAISEQKVADIERQQLAGDTNKILLRQREQQARTASREAETAMARSKALEEELNALKAKKTDRGFVLTLGDVLFATGKADLMAGAQRTIDQLAAFLNKYPNKNVSVEGHTDSKGSESFNLMLSQSRAESVRSAIMARGISSNRITVEGLGEMYPVASNDTSAGRQQNRRVEIVISPGD